jgi:hypothetical protein
VTVQRTQPQPEERGRRQPRRMKNRVAWGLVLVLALVLLIGTGALILQLLRTDVLPVPGTAPDARTAPAGPG